jgi:hypothetical protein
VGATGVEPARISPKDPKSFASANSATRPDVNSVYEHGAWVQAVPARNRRHSEPIHQRSAPVPGVPVHPCPSATAEHRNPKSETRNPKQIRNSKGQMLKTGTWAHYRLGKRLSALWPRLQKPGNRAQGDRPQWSFSLHTHGARGVCGVLNGAFLKTPLMYIAERDSWGNGNTTPPKPANNSGPTEARAALLPQGAGTDNLVFVRVYEFEWVAWIVTLDYGYVGDWQP